MVALEGSRGEGQGHAEVREGLSHDVSEPWKECAKQKEWLMQRPWGRRDLEDLG
jgi:hypothetical protein